MVEAVPVTLITGFLGAGKTTLLNHLMLDPALANTAVLIDELGEAGLDLRLALRGLLPRRVIIETTGIADPAAILETLAADPILARMLRFDGVITVVDAVYGELSLDRYPQARRQVALANRLLLTKTDLIDTPALRSKLAAINPAAPIITVRDGIVDTTAIIDIGAAPPALTNDLAHHHDVQSFCLSFDQPLNPEVFAGWLQLLIATEGEKLLRVKGILDLAGQDRPVALDAVRHLLHPPSLLAAWPPGPRQSRILFVTENLPRAVIEHSLQAFNRTAAEAASL